MSDLSRKIDEAAAHVRPAWDESRARDVERGMHRKRARRARTRAAAMVAAPLAVLALVVWFARPLASPVAAVPSAGPTATALASAMTPAALRLEDGSVADPLDVRTVMRVVARTPERVQVDLERGGARFDVAKNPSRAFRVHAGKVDVEVIGTAFSVERRDDERVRVAVDRGLVRVTYEGGHVELGAGQAGTYPPDDVAPAPSASAPSTPAPPGASTASSAPSPTASSSVGASSLPPDASWRALARDGDFDRAYEALRREGADPVRDEPGDLLLAADVARLSRHPAQAVGPLRAVFEKHAGDPRAPLAAFTLGRVYLDELGQPRQAADAFARARQLAPGGALAGDALAREVEAWSRAGDATRARERADEYVRAYPNGAKLRSVRKFGGLD